MAYLLSDELLQLDIGNGDWVKIKKEITYWDYINVIAGKNFEDVVKRMIVDMVKEWSLKDGKGNPIPCIQENILRLDPDSSDVLFLEMSKILDNFKQSRIDKKKQKNSSPQSDTVKKQGSPMI
jgi:hypothetical protein